MLLRSRGVPALVRTAVLFAALSGARCFDSAPDASLQTSLFKQAQPPRELASGDTLAPGDELYLTVMAHRARYLYVVSEDAAGERLLLYPCRTWGPSRPLGAGRRYRLPPPVLGRPAFWPVGSVTSRERLRVVASVRPLDPLERAVRSAADAPPCAIPVLAEANRWLDGLIRRHGEDVSISTYELAGRASHG